MQNPSGSSCGGRLDETGLKKEMNIIHYVISFGRKDYCELKLEKLMKDVLDDESPTSTNLGNDHEL